MHFAELFDIGAYHTLVFQFGLVIWLALLLDIVYYLHTCRLEVDLSNRWVLLDENGLRKEYVR